MILGLWLFAVGACDLLRAARDATSPLRRTVLAVFGCALLGAAGAAAGFTASWWWTAGLAWVVSLVAWVVTSSVALDPGTRRPGAWRAAAFVSFVAPLLVLGLVGAALPTPVTVPIGWEDTLVGRLGPERAAVLAGVVLLELSTANILVRLLLDGIGVPAATNEASLKGGRLLGPMERLFILLLALGGELTAAAVVVAAKGLLRFPELQRSSQEQGPTAVSEYFLVGSFASWMLGILGWLIAGPG